MKKFVCRVSHTTYLFIIYMIALNGKEKNKVKTQKHYHVAFHFNHCILEEGDKLFSPLPCTHPMI